MKPVTCIILIIVIAGLMTAVWLSVHTVIPDRDEPPDVPIDYKAGTKVIDRRYTPPDTYEVLYRTTFTNGLTVTMWRGVSREEYEKYKETKYER